MASTDTSLAPYQGPGPLVDAHRVPPQNLDAERSVLGGVLIDNQALDKIMDIITGDDFYKESHRVIFESMQRLNARGDPVDELTLTQQLRQDEALDKAGGLSYVAALSQAVPTAAHVMAYAKIVRDKATQRRLIGAATEIVRQGYREDTDLSQFIDSAERTIFEATEDRRRRAIKPIKEVLKTTFRNLEEIYNRGEAVTGVPTGFKRLDGITSGLQKSDLVIIAARPSMGKTALALNIAGHAAIKAKIPTLLFSLEMSAEQLVSRFLGAEARVNLGDLRRGRIQETEWPRLAQAAGRISDAALYIDDSGVLTVTEMRSKCRRVMKEHGLGLAIVDYLQLMQGTPGNESNRVQEISEISRGLKALARELDVPVIALSQLSRSLESRPDKRPMLSDLRESGAIEQDADVVMFVYREEYYKREETPPDLVGVAEIIIGKQRNGPTGALKLMFHKEYTRFENLEEDRDI
ncbi:MAG: replicative DNA helicase [Deltaproteobacteria bacterium]|nr:replicative DNA helicase [Deltaproteobacteria bacterium]